MRNKAHHKSTSEPFKACVLALLICAIVIGSQVVLTSQSFQAHAQEAPVPSAPPETQEHSNASAKPSKIKRVLKRFKDVITPGQETPQAQTQTVKPPRQAWRPQANPVQKTIGYGERVPVETGHWSRKPSPQKLKQRVVPITKDGYLLAVPGYKFKFPRDHASHPQFKTEWWYYTGHLYTDDGERYGYELTFFRSGIPVKNPPNRSLWRLKDIYAAHFAITDLNRNRFVFAERLNRNSPYAGAGLAQADTNRFYVLNDTWGTWKIAQKLDLVKPITAQSTLVTERDKTNAAKSEKVNAAEVVQKPKRNGKTQQFWLQADMTEADQPKKENRYKLSLTLTPTKIPVIHGKDGVSQKADCKGCASHYYSFTRLASTGTIWVNGQPKRVRGLSWMDREFGSNQLTSVQTGWDWFSIQLDNRTELMLYVLRNEKKQNGKIEQYLDPNSSGTLYFADGKARHLKRNDFKIKAIGHWRSAATKADYPMGWQVNIPAYGMELFLSPDMREQELVTHQSTSVAYWEGANTVKGTMRGKPVAGKAYVEMTGYAQKFRQRI